MKNEAEAYMLKELSRLKWQEKATNLAAEENSARMANLQTTLLGLEESLKSKRFFPEACNVIKVCSFIVAYSKFQNQPLS